MATGNFAGIAGLQFNPASIVDSRYKFDLNIAAIQYTYDNNYLNMKPGVFVRRLFKKDPYNSSWDAVKTDLLSRTGLAPETRVYARQQQNFLLPLSMMITTGKRSAVALSLRNRYITQMQGLNVATADMIYDQLRNPAQYGITMNNDGFQTRFMNWQEIGFTYGRVLFNWNRHFMKAAVTAKWLGANAGAVIEAEQLSVRFADSQHLSMQSPSITYARTQRADFGAFNRVDFARNLEGQSVGFDVGLVYEFRGRIGKFKYTDEDMESRLRRDKNKYTLRLGVALNDIGKVSFDNRLALTRNHSASFNNWDFGGVKANSIGNWDTAYARQVNYFANQEEGFSIQLPTAFIANADLHLFGGFYINAAMQRNVNKIDRGGTTRLRNAEWYAITPRFEGRFFGIYTPIIMARNGNKDELTFGATVRLGPLYVGSNNLLDLVQNTQTPRADVHAGFRIPIAYGKPTKLSRMVEKETGVSLSDGMDSLETRNAALEARVAVLEQMADTGWRPTVIVNNYITDSMGKTAVQSQVSGQQTRSQQTASATYTQQQVDSINSENDKLRQDVKKQMKKEGIQEPKAPKTSKNEKKNRKREDQYRKDQKQYNDAIEKEMRKSRKQDAITSAALISAVSAGVIVDANGNKVVPDTIRVVKTDTIYQGGQRVDTVYVRDTVKAAVAGTAVAPTIVAPVAAPETVRAPEYFIYFDNASATVSPAYKDILDEVGKTIRLNPEKVVHLVGRTDATGSPSANKSLANKRLDAVVQQLKLRGINLNQIEREVNVSDEQTKVPAEEKRRVEIVIGN